MRFDIGVESFSLLGVFDRFEIGLGQHAQFYQSGQGGLLFCLLLGVSPCAGVLPTVRSRRHFEALGMIRPLLIHQVILGRGAGVLLHVLLKQGFVITLVL